MQNKDNPKEIKYDFFSKAAQVFPPMIIVEITNVCQIKCVHCPHTYIADQNDYKPKHMSWLLYEKIVNEVAQYPGTIFRILCDGEPLCHPRFKEMLRYAKDQNIAPMNFITNGLLLDESMANFILNIGIEAVEISLDAKNKKTYEKIRKGSNYDLVIKNVHKFIQLRNEKQSKTKILVSIIEQPESEAEHQNFIDYWTPKVDKVISRVYTSIHRLVDASKMKIDQEGERWPCPHLWRRFYVNVDGFAEFCVEDWYGKSIVGDVNVQSVREIWSSDKYQKIRSAHLAHKFQEVPYCFQCLDWKARDWHYNYFHALEEILD